MLIKNILKTLIILLCLTACSSSNTIFNDRKRVTLLIDGKHSIETILSVTSEEQNIGLSGTRDKDFKKNQAMLFFYKEDGMRKFWMPNTLFDLDIFFLDSNMKVIAIERNVPHHPGVQEPPAIYRTKTYNCRHVLEMRSDSPLAKELEVGEKVITSKGSYL